jgi:hypothetical protein
MLPFICCGEAARPWSWQLHCPAAPEPPALLSVCLFGSTTVAIPLGDMFERGELTNIPEDQFVFQRKTNWADHPAADGTGHLSTKITCNVENLSLLCGAPKRLIMIESGILFFRIFSCVPNVKILITDVEFFLS